MLAVKLNQVYKHFKGGVCIVVGIALDSETQERRVQYQEVEILPDKSLAMAAGSTPWSRLESMFTEVVTPDEGDPTKRFKFMGKCDTRTPVAAE